jgi:ACDE family multidrug resistance protein
MVLGNSMLIPVLPTAGRVLHISATQTSLLITLFSIPAAIVIPFAGILADRIGRKKVIIVALSLYGLGGLLSGIAAIYQGGSYPFMLASRILQGIGAAGTSPIAMVLVSDLYTKSARGKALGVIEASNAMGKVLSPILGSLLALITWYAMFFAFPILCIPIILALWKLIEEPSVKNEAPPLQVYKQHIVKVFQRHGKWLVVAFLAGSLALLTMFGVLFYLSDLLEKDYRIDGILKGLILAIPLLALCATSYFTGSFIKEKTFQMKKLIHLGLTLTMLTMAAFPFFTNLIILLSISFVMGIGCGLILPCLNTLVTSAVGIQERGIITSLYGSVRFLGAAIGPPIFSALSNRPYLLYLGLSALLAITLLLAIFFIRRPQRLKGREERYRILIRKKRLSSATP